jgi:hypothetical protein
MDRFNSSMKWVISYNSIDFWVGLIYMVLESCVPGFIVFSLDITEISLTNSKCAA